MVITSTYELYPTCSTLLKFCTCLNISTGTVDFQWQYDESTRNLNLNMIRVLTICLVSIKENGYLGQAQLKFLKLIFEVLNFLHMLLRLTLSNLFALVTLTNPVKFVCTYSFLQLALPNLFAIAYVALSRRVPHADSYVPYELSLLCCTPGTITSYQTERSTNVHAILLTPPAIFSSLQSKEVMEEFIADVLASGETIQERFIDSEPEPVQTSGSDTAGGENSTRT